MWTRVIAVALCLLGAVWIAQGLGVLGGSAMSGHAIWAFFGALLAFVGLVLLLRPSRSVKGEGDDD